MQPEWNLKKKWRLKSTQDLLPELTFEGIIHHACKRLMLAKTEGLGTYGEVEFLRFII